MGTDLSPDAYADLIEEDIDWLEKNTEHSLERMHIIQLLKNSTKEYRERCYSIEKSTDQLEDEIRLLREQVSHLQKMMSYEYEAEDGIPLDKCPKCGGVADNGFDRCCPPSPYWCTKCEQAYNTLI